MNPVKAFARLGAKAGNLSPTIHGTGGTALKPADIAGMLKGLKGGPYYLGMFSWGLDSSSLPNLRFYTRMMVVDMMNARGWKPVRGKEVSKGLAELAILDAFAPKRCGRCEGRGIEQRRGGLIVDCSKCGGTGNGERSNRENASIVGIDHKAWAGTWEKRYREVYDEMSEWQNIAFRHVKKQLRLSA